MLAWFRVHVLPLAALTFMAGLTLAVRLHGLWPDFPAGPLVLGLVLCCLLALWRLPPGTALVWAGLPLWFLVGCGHGWQALDRQEQNLLHRLTQERVRVTVQGQVLDMVIRAGDQVRCTLAVQALLRHDAAKQGFVAVRGKVLLRLRGQPGEELQPGAQVLALGWATPPRPGRAGDALAARGLAATLSLSGPAALKVLKPGPTGFWQGWRFALEQRRQRMAHFLSTHFAPDLAAVYQALLIGAPQSLSPERAEQFRACGCLHILAISGLHLGLVAALLAGLAYWALKHSRRVLLWGHGRALALALAVPPLCLYACLAGLNIPVLRALLTALLALSILVLCRRRAQLHLTAAAALLVLALWPLALFTASFQLSFAAVAALTLVLPHLPLFQAAQAREERLLPRVRAALLSLFLVSLAATLGTLPFMLWHFNRVSLIGPLMNLAIEPLLCLIALPLGLLGLALLLLVPSLSWLALVPLHLGALAIRAALFLLEQGARLPFAQVWTSTPHPLEMLAFCAAILLIFQKKAVWRQMGGALVLMVLVSFLAPLWFQPARQEARAHILDVGQGSATLLELPDGQRILADCGGFFQEDYEVGSRRVAPFLWQRRIWRLDAVLASHADSDHYSGLPFIVARFGPRTLYVNGSRKPEAGYQALLATAVRRGLEVRVVTGQEILAQGPGWQLEAFGLPVDSAYSENDRSLLLRLKMGEKALLLPGDAAAVREQALLQEAAADRLNLRADLLVAGHHGSIGSTTPDFLAAVAPKVVLVSASAAKQGTHPAPEHLARWRSAGIRVWSTAESGNIQVVTDGKRLCVEASGQRQCW